MTLRLILLALCFSLCACGSNYRASGSRGAVAVGAKISIKATSEDADPGIRNAIKSELGQRGLRVVDAPAADSLILSYYDDWKWDLVTYLWALNVQISEPRSGKILATGDFGHFGFHHYPDNRQVVRKVFEKIDNEGVFRR